MMDICIGFPQMSNELVIRGIASDRIAVIYKGEFIDIFDIEKTTVKQIGLLMGGGRNIFKKMLFYPYQF